MLVCQKLKKQFRDGQSTVDVLHEINLSVAPGERVAILGSSGSGKSTLLHLLGGLDVPTEGTVSIDECCLSRQSEAQRSRLRNRYLGFIYQFHHLLPEFNVIENVSMPLLIKGVSAAAAAPQAKALLEKVGLDNYKHYRISALSGGQRQRVAIARAVVTKPAYVLADEPTGNLDAHTAESIYQLIDHLSETSNTSFVIATHDTQLASRLDRQLVLKDGRLSNI